MGNIIYEKRYPREDAEGIEALSKTLDKETEETQQIPTFEEFLRRVYENQACILIPERQRLAEKFIRTACEVSKLYRLDIKITQYSDHISVDYYFNAVGGLRYLREIVKYADEISFFANSMGYDIVMCLDFYTHAVFRNGHLMHP